MAPRYSIIPGDFCDDARATLVHYKVLARLGRQSSKGGWCVLAQGRLATAVGVARATVNAAISDLVAWGYVAKRSQAETKTSYCHYRIVMDRGSPEDVEPLDDGVNLPPGVSATGDTGVSATADTGVSATGDTPRGVSATGDRGVSSASTDTITFKSPLGESHTHTTETRVCVDLQPEGVDEDPLGWLLDGKADHVVERLIRPLSRLRMRATDFPAPKLTLAAIRDRHAGESDSVLDAAALALTGSRTTHPSEAQVKAAIDKARTTHAVLMAISPDSPSWGPWLAHWRATGHPKRASIAEQQGRTVVDREWPPGAAPEGRAAP